MSFHAGQITTIYIYKTAVSDRVSTLTAVCVSRRRPPSCFWPDGSPKFVIVLRWSNRWPRDHRNHVAPKSKPNLASQKPNLTKLSFEHVSFSWNRTFRRLSRVGLSVFRGSVGKKKFQNPTIHVSIISQGTSIHCQYDEHALWSCSSLKKKTCHFFHAHGHDRLLFWRKLQWKKFWMEGNRHQQSEPAGHRHGVKRETDWMETRRSTSLHGKDFTWRSRETEEQAASRRGSNQEHMSYTIRKRLFFFSPTEVQSRAKFLHGVICGFNDHPKSEEAVWSHRSEATKLSGVRMPEQRRAGLLVIP